jgi:hypothetical protein
MIKFLNRFGFWISLVVCGIVYLSLAYKNPFKDNNLIPNLEPSPDVFYYSVPAWNFVHGRGFKMEAFGVQIPPLPTPLYSIYLIPFFKIFNDVRSYYYANLVLGIISIYLFLKLVINFFSKEKLFLAFCLGLIFVTNFYFYNLPTLLMSENILIPLTLMLVILTFRKLNISNFIFTLLVMGILAFTKISTFPTLLICSLVLLVKLFKSKFWKKLPKIILLGLGILILTGVTVAFIKIARPAIKELPSASAGFSLKFISKTLPIYLKEFLGIGGSYLWYQNQQIETIMSVACLIGLVLGLVFKKYRNKILVLLGVILGVTVFHSMMSYPEGRYISVVIPLYLIFAGVIFDKLKSKVWLVIFMAIYFLSRYTVNGFYERKITSLKRQILNNRLEENEKPWHHIAITRLNNYFSDKKNVYLGTLLNPFYIMYFGNGNYNFLPLSPGQEFAGPGKGFIDKYLEKDKTVANLYKRILNEGNELYVTNYYLTYYKGNMDSQYYDLEKVFWFTQVDEGCLGECKLYKLELKK